MRKISAFALASCLTLGATAALAQTATAPSTDTATSASAATTATSTTTTTTTHKAKHHVKHTVKGGHASGAITAMDATAKTVTLKDTYNVTDDTKYMAKGKSIMMSDLHVGDTVSVSYTKDGMKATKITVTKAAKM
jgi:sRNA-binding protein